MVTGGLAFDAEDVATTVLTSNAPEESITESQINYLSENLPRLYVVVDAIGEPGDKELLSSSGSSLLFALARFIAVLSGILLLIEGEKKGMSVR